MIDSHCHLADKAFDSDFADVLLRAEEHGISAMVTIADSLSEADECVRLAEEYEQLFCTVGVHPHNAKDWQDGDDQKLRVLVARCPKVKAIGEIGLDYHYDFSPREAQQHAFRAQLALAKELKLPAVIHCREAIDDLCATIAEINPPSFVVHCCTEQWKDVAILVERGGYLGFTGIATFPNATDIRNTIKHCPIEQILLETDAPYLAPAPYRGKRNEPAYVLEVGKLISELKGLSFADVDRITTQNTAAFYRL